MEVTRKKVVMMSLEADLAERNLKIRRLLDARGLSALILTSRDHFEYFTGFRTMLWASFARPYFAIITPDDSSTKVLVPPIEMRNAEYNPGGCDFIYYEGFVDEALTCLEKTLARSITAGSLVGVDYGDESFGRGFCGLEALVERAGGRVPVIEAANVIWDVRMFKSEFEITQKRRACKIATDAFFQSLPLLRIGNSEQDFARALASRMFLGGAESVDWLPVRFGTGRWPAPRHPTSRPLSEDDFLWTDMGCSFEGYKSDVSRVAKAGMPSSQQQAEYGRIRELTLAFGDAVRPGMTCDEIAREFGRLVGVSSAKAGRPNSTVAAPAGRVAHGSGLGYTEPPSVMQGSAQVIRPGMVLHVEPRSEFADGVFQTEEVLVVRDQGIEWLSELAPASLPVIEH
ncbi:MAG TPA: M24 family metallopeptidase [Sphingobium sp.]|uniref:M24 family metallopeptidase n=1 Tax=Sphingobium sp. TaxID=1912891 RepID=UPI002ED554C9